MADADPRREEEFEERWEAAPAVALVIALQLILAGTSLTQDWTVSGLPWWVWLIGTGPEAALLVPLARDSLRYRLQRSGYRRSASFALFAVISLANVLLLVAVIVSLLRGDDKSGARLLLEAGTVWSTNVITYGLWFWALDRGGPDRRRRRDPPPPDFQFPQLENPQLAEPGWHPRLIDYVYVSFTTRSPSARPTPCRSRGGPRC